VPTGASALTPARKLVYAGVAIVMALAAIEAAARTYKAVRLHDPAPLTYGAGFLRQTLSRPSAAPVGDDERRSASERAADQAFERRHAPIPTRRPTEAEDRLIDGHLSHANTLGLRGPELDSAPDPTRRRIATFGGSYVFGAFLDDHETWPRLLEGHLRDRGLSVEVLNAGVNGYSIHDVLRSVIQLTGDVHTDYALVTSAYNNRHLLAMDRHYTLARRVDAFLYNVSLFHVMLKEKISLFSRQPVDHALYQQPVHVEPSAIASWIAMYRRRLEQVATVCRERGVTLVLASQPELFQDTRLNALNTLDERAVDAIESRIAHGEEVPLSDLEFFMQGRQNIEALRFSRGSPGVLFFDGANVFPADRVQYFLDPIHPGPLGAARLAAALAEFFTPVLRPGLTAAK